MKTFTKFALAAIAVSSLFSASVLADDVRTIERYNNHGTGTIVYRQCQSCQSPSVAVYAQGQSYGNAAPAADSGAALHFCVKGNNHGGSRFSYRAE
jgi:hypothetical protein